MGRKNDYDRRANCCRNRNYPKNYRKHPASVPIVAPHNSDSFLESVAVAVVAVVVVAVAVVDGWAALRETAQNLY